MQPVARADLVVWGPYPTTLRQTVGEVVGVVRDGERDPDAALLAAEQRARPEDHPMNTFGS